MTREEALTQLRLGPGINEDVSEDYNNAVDMAIEALEQEPCEDAISREEAIDACNQSLNILEATDRIKDLPPVTPQEPILDKIRAIVDEWQSDTWTDNLSYECMIKIAELVKPQESEDK